MMKNFRESSKNTDKASSKQLLAQISDCHLDTKNQSIPSLKTTLKLLTCYKPDALIATGDLVDEHNDPTYNLLAQELTDFKKQSTKDLTTKIGVIGGNHDESVLLNKHLRNYQKTCLQLDYWCVIFINSVVDKEMFGRINKKEFIKLKQELKRNNKKNIILTLHHAPLAINKNWDDSLLVDNGEELLNFLTQNNTINSNIKAITWGHVHEYTSSYYKGVSCYSCPSTNQPFDKHNPNNSRCVLFELYDNGDIKPQLIAC